MTKSAYHLNLAVVHLVTRSFNIRQLHFFPLPPKGYSQHSNFEMPIFQRILFYTECPISPRPRENSVMWQNTEQFKKGKVVNYVFPISGVGILFSQDEPLRRYTLYIINSKKLRLRCHDSERGMSFQSRGKW
jgi:hypothetical protein